jgi:hypothetical protein
MVVEKPRLHYKAESRRRPYFRRFMWMLLGTVAAAACWLALAEAQARGESLPELLEIGVVVAIIVMGLLFIRALVNLIRWFSTRAEKVYVFDQGFIWERNDEQYKYSWMQLRSFREGANTLRLFGRPLLTTGAHKLLMRDGEEFAFTGRLGDVDRFAHAIRNQIAETTGTVMGRALRNNKTVRLHPNLIVKPKGLVVDKHRIPWSRVNVETRGRKLDIQRLNDDGKFKTVKTFNIRDIDNLGGFLELADSTIRNHQPERFNVKTYEMV